MAPDSQLPVLSVVAPLYNEEQTVQELVTRLLQSCRQVHETFEVVLVDDGSRDRTLERLRLLSELHPELRIVRLFRNFGPMAAVQAGVAAARGQAVVTIDGDLQDPPELIPRLFSHWRDGAHVVLAQREEREEGWLQQTGTKLFYWLLQKTSETPVPKQAGIFGLMDRRVADVIKAMPERQRFFAGLRAWAGGRQAVVLYNRQARGYGESKMGIGRLFRLGRMALVSFSKTPLRLASYASLLFSLILLIIGLSAIAIRLFTDLAVPGWATTTTLLGLVGSIQSLVLAILSEYVAVLFDEIKARPLYVVEDEFVSGKAVQRELK